MSSPARIQLRRTKGFNLQEASLALNGLECVNVARPSRWGNPYPIDMYGLELSLALFRNTVNGIWNPSILKNHSDKLCDSAYVAHHAFMKRLGGHPLELARSFLRGHNLACWCDASHPCHADIWLEISNGGSI